MATTASTIKQTNVKKRTNTYKFYRSHRFYARLVAVPTILWALSGMLHPIMANWFKPTIAHQTLPSSTFSWQADWLEPRQLADKNQLSTLEQLHLVKIGDQVAYQHQTAEGSTAYFNINTGALMPNAEVQLVKQLASGFSGFDAELIKGVEKITEFRSDYNYVNRYLPVYRVSFDTEDEFEVFIDPESQKLAAFSNHASRLYKQFFAWTHNWIFLGATDNILRIIIVLIVMSLITWVGIAGVLTFFTLKAPKAQDGTSQRAFRFTLHRYVGLLTSVFFIALAFSGTVHTLSKFIFDRGFLESSLPSVPSDNIQYPLSEAFQQSKEAVRGLSMAYINNEPFYRLNIESKNEPGKTCYVSAISGQVKPNADALYAQQLAKEFAQVDASQVGDSTLITQFGKHYPAILKRLPVQQMKLTDAPYLAVTVDTQNSRLVSRLKLINLLESQVFLTLHKLHFLDPISKDFRDWMTLFATFMITLTASLGLFATYYRSRKQ